MSLIRAMEVWTPDAERTHLYFSTGAYQGLGTFEATSLQTTFWKGQGLPGQVWAQKAPLIFEDLTAARGFVRAEVAQIAGLTAGLGLPILQRNQLTAVVTLLLSSQAGGSGVVEIWQRKAARGRLVWSAGYYGDLRAFEALSRQTSFVQGEGLPGRVLEVRGPVLFEDLSAARGFVRAGAAAEAGLAAGLGIPVFCDGQVQYVVLLLTPVETPVARVMEIWQPDAAHRKLELAAGFYGRLEAFRAVSAQTTFVPGEGLPGQVYARTAPVLFEQLNRRSGFVRSTAAARAGLQAALGFPVLDGDAVRAVVVLFN